MTNSQQLLKDLKTQLGRLQEDLRSRASGVPEFDRALRTEYAAAAKARRTADTFETWREDPITQAAVAWVLGTVFVRFLEDNGLIEPRISGVGDNRGRAFVRHGAYGLQHPLETDREYLLHVFQEVGQLPAGREIFHERHNPLWRLTPSGDAAKNLVEFWQRIDPATGKIAHDLLDPEWDTRLLGDLYQDLSESARKKYALLQTPRFVEAFILDRTLTPAIEAFGYRETTLIDPTCGSGHFLLGAFERLLKLYQQNEPAVNERERVQRVLSQIAGVDLNPFAAAIARFRLLIAALRACGITRLSDAPAFEINVAAGDSLLHGKRFSERRAVQVSLDPDDPSHHHFATEDERVDRILDHQYHAVVGNPPYITVKDRALNNLYRQRYGSCHMKYALVVPFVERFFELALNGTENTQAGFVGAIVSNSFMKREFGKKLIENYLKGIDLTHVIDTSGAYVPGHGTPTVVLFGRNRAPSGPARTVMGIRGEPSTPDDPAAGQVWSAILQQVDVVGSESAFVGVRDLQQSELHSHPWSIGGGGASELKELLDERAVRRLGDIATSIGITSFTLEDDLFLLPENAADRRRIEVKYRREMIVGDAIRDWSVAPCDTAVFPYDSAFEPIQLENATGVHRYLWTGRTSLANNAMFGGKTKVQSGLRWFEYGRLTLDKLRTPLTITFAEVATHNHFVLDRGGKVFKQTAPVIKLPADATDDDHYTLLGLLNSSTACFWIKQVCQTKGSSGMGRGVYDEKWEFLYQVDASKLLRFPVSQSPESSLAANLDSEARRLSELTVRVSHTADDERRIRDEAETARRNLVGFQEELDWAVYRLYGLAMGLPDSRGAIRLEPGQRAFEIVMARRMLTGDLETSWFERHGSTPIAELPAGWPEDYKALVESRIELIETDRNIGLLEQPEYKRRWNAEPWERQQERALRNWLLDRLETSASWPAAVLTTTAKVADLARQDAEFMQVAEVFRGRPDFDVTALVTELATAESVPYLPVLCYADAGLRKRAQWEQTWERQRQEDAIDARADLPDADPRKLTTEQAAKEKKAQVGDIPVPPKYTSADFQKGDYWRLRGKLDVPKERFIIYPGAERSVDPTPVVGWAGWGYLQQAQALADYYVAMQEQEGWAAERLTPLLAGLLELVPWLKQWHNDLDPQFQLRMGDYFDDFVQTQARALGLTLEQVKAWTPVAPGAPARRQRRGRA